MHLLKGIEYFANMPQIRESMSDEEWQKARELDFEKLREKLNKTKEKEASDQYIKYYHSYGYESDVLNYIENSNRPKKIVNKQMIDSFNNFKKNIEGKYKNKVDDFSSYYKIRMIEKIRKK